MTPLVSILIPAFNAEQWIGATIESAIAQTWRNKEIIVVDDGSTDRTFSVARTFQSREVQVITQPNATAAAARNKALSLSKGEYIQWLDADDVLAPDKISRQMHMAMRCGSTRTLLSSPWGYFRHRIHKAQFRPTALWRDLTPLEWLLCKLETNVFMQTGSWLVTRQLTEAAGPWDTRLLGDDDGEYFCRVVLASGKVCFVPNAKVFYRQVPGNRRLSSIGISKIKAAAHLLSIRLHIQHVRTLEDSPRVRSACLQFLRDNTFYFYPEWPQLFSEAQMLANELGGQLDVPQLPPKYAWIRPLLGWSTAKRTQLYYNHCKAAVMSSWDHALLRLNL